MEHAVRHPARWARPPAMLAIALGAALSPPAGAQASDAWRFGASVYGYLPSLGGSTRIPADSSGTSINVDADQILSKLKFTFMGALDAHNGRWGVFTDLIYLDLGDTEERSRSFTIGDIGLPVGTSARLTWDLKGLAWTLAGQYRLVADPALTLDALGGARLFNLRQTLDWDISGDIGPLDPARRTGSADARIELWDGIVGVKGRYDPAPNNPWSFPFYVDVGAGDSKLTWQAAVGVTYAFSWGELTGMWRYLSYEMKSGSTITSLNFNGPMFGATWRW